MAEGPKTLHKLFTSMLKPCLPAPVRRGLRALQRRLHPAPPPAPESGFPEWPHWLRQDQRLWDRALQQAQHGPLVLLATSLGGFPAALLLESVLGAALTLRGARVRFLLCDKSLPACLQTHERPPDPGMLERYELSQVLCAGCYGRGCNLHAGLGLPVWRYGNFLSAGDRAEAKRLAGQLPANEIAGFRWHDQAVGEHALAGTLRFYARGQLADAPGGETTLRRFFEAALLTSMAMRDLLAKVPIARACFHHGIYVPQGLIAEACRAAKVPLATWNVAYRKGCFIFSHDDTYHHTMLSEPAATWENMLWGPEQETEVMDYLASRLTGARDWIWFHERPVEDVARINGELGIDPAKPIVGLLTNVFWDAQLHYRANAFKDMLDWTLQTIRYFADRPDLQLLIRIHPAEVRGSIPSRQPLLAEIEKAIPKLPANVFIIPPESNSSTYAAMYQCDSVLIYGTKTGVELSSMGIPVIVAGEAWVRGKGVTRDARTPEEYFRILDTLPVRQRLDAATKERARKYAYHFFFRRMIPLPFMGPPQTPAVPYSVEISGLRDLLPGRHPGLDIICDGILKGTPFIYPAERFVLAKEAA